MTIDEVQQYYQTYFKQMVLFASRYIADFDQAQDLVQDVFVHLFTTDLSLLDNPKAFLYTATKNKCLDHLKLQRIRNNHHHFLQYHQTDSFFEDAMEKSEMESFLMGIIDKLPSKCKVIFTKSRFDGMSNEEIALELALSKRTVETQISNALKKIRIELESFRSLILTLF